MIVNNLLEMTSDGIHFKILHRLLVVGTLYDIILKAVYTILYSLIGIAMPYPLESSVLPICIRLQLRSVWYSMLDDSMRNAYRPLPLSTRSTPSWLLFVNTVGLDASITLHILWYKLKFDLCTMYIERHYLYSCFFFFFYLKYF